MVKTASGRPAPRYGASGTLLVTTQKPAARSEGTLYCDGRWFTQLVGSMSAHE